MPTTARSNCAHDLSGVFGLRADSRDSVQRPRRDQERAPVDEGIMVEVTLHRLHTAAGGVNRPETATLAKRHGHSFVGSGHYTKTAQLVSCIRPSVSVPCVPGVNHPVKMGGTASAPRKNTLNEGGRGCDHGTSSRSAAAQDSGGHRRSALADQPGRPELRLVTAKADSSRACLAHKATTVPGR